MKNNNSDKDAAGINSKIERNVANNSKLNKKELIFDEIK